MTGINANPPVRRPLKMLRLLAGLTQRQVAERIRSDKATISDYERGAVTPSATRLREIAEVLGVTTDEIDLGVAS